MNLPEEFEAMSPVQQALTVAEVFQDPLNIARMMEDLGNNGRIDDEELRPLVEQLAVVAQEALA